MEQNQNQKENESVRERRDVTHAERERTGEHMDLNFSWNRQQSHIVMLTT